MKTLHKIIPLLTVLVVSAGAARADLNAPDIAQNYKHRPSSFDKEQCVLCGKPGYMDAASMIVTRLNDTMIRADFKKSNGWSDGSVTLERMGDTDESMTYQKQLSENRDVYLTFDRHADGRIYARLQYSKRIHFITSWSESAYRSFVTENIDP